MIQARDIDFSYDHKNYVLKEFSLHVRKSEIVAIMGTSGSGKSTLLDILGGLKPPMKGEVEVNHKSLYDMSSKELEEFKLLKMGYIFQNFNLLPFLNVYENVMLPAMILKKKDKRYGMRCNELLSLLNIQELRHREIQNLTGGERQRVAIARALIMSPELVLADEPTGALDRKNTTSFMEYFIQISKRMSTTVVIVTHDEKVSAYCDRTILIG